MKERSAETEKDTVPKDVREKNVIVGSFSVRVYQVSSSSRDTAQEE